VPYVIAIAGSVSAGKSTTARVLRTLLSRWPDHPRVDLVTTDGFLFPNAVLNERELMQRKGFPESYDRPRLVRYGGEARHRDPRGFEGAAERHGAFRVRVGLRRLPMSDSRLWTTDRSIASLAT